MLLDTFPFLSGAIRLYRTLGFYEIPSYNNSPLDSLIYMRKDLCPACSFAVRRHHGTEKRNRLLYTQNCKRVGPRTNSLVLE